MGPRQKPAVILAAGLLAAAMAGGGYILIDQASDSTCEEHMAQAAEQQAELIEDNGASAPNLDFNFPDSCFE